MADDSHVYEVGQVYLSTPTIIWKKRFLVIAALAWLALAASPSLAQVPGTITKLSTSDMNNQQTSPGISGSKVVWTSTESLPNNFTNFDVYLMDLSSQSLLNLTPTPNEQEFLPDISGNLIVWTHSTSTIPGDIVLYDITAGTQNTIAASNDSTYFSEPAIKGHYIAFLRNSISSSFPDVVVYNPIQGQTVASITDVSVKAHPRVGADYVVYEDYSTGHAQVKAWQISTNGPSFAISPGPDDQTTPDIDGNSVTYVQSVAGYNQLFVYDLVTQTATQLTTAVSAKVQPRISGSRIVWSDDRSGNFDIYLYDLAMQTELRLVGGPGDQYLPSIDGDRVVYTDNFSGFNQVFLFTIMPNGGDFSFNSIAPMTIVAGGSSSASVTVNPTNGFSSAVNLSVSGQPAGVMASLSPNSVTPLGNSASSVLNVALPSFLTPTSFSLTVSGASGTLNHSAAANVTVTATSGSTLNSITDMLSAGCIDNAGIGNALTSKLFAAQSAGNVQTAINTLTALKNQILAQAGKHIHTTCTISGVTFNPVNVLLLDVQALIDNLRVGLIPDPITGYVVDANGVGLAVATVSILDGGAAVVATTTTDITGFYFLATTGVLSPGAPYTLVVTGLPVGFGAVTPPNQPFTWQGGAIVFSNFVLN